MVTPASPRRPPPIRVLIVEDSVTQREIFRRLLSADPEFCVIGEARDGSEALEQVVESDPDVVLMDIHMPDMDGIAATREIMRRHPVPIVVASATLRARDVDLAMRAYEAGAIAVIEKPAGAVLLHLHKMAPELRSELLAAAQVRLKAPARVAAAAASAPAQFGEPRRPSVEVIGIVASTGGPPVLRQILTSLPPAFPIPLLLVQHICRGFEEGFVRWLGADSGQQVRLAESGRSLQAGCWFGPPGRHLVLNSVGRLELVPGGAGDIHCPSGDRLLDSLARHAGPRAAGIVLTGMGDDGAQGLLALKRAGGLTISQDESSALIWGMPKACRERGASCQELDPPAIVRTLCELAERSTAGARLP